MGSTGAGTDELVGERGAVGSCVNFGGMQGAHSGGGSEDNQGGCLICVR